MIHSRLLPIIVMAITSCHAYTKAIPHTLEACHNAHLSDAWYTQDSKTLDKELSDYLAQACTATNRSPLSTTPHALIVPHAGYYYSGLCAATAYASLLTNGQPNSTIKRVIILAPAHTRYFTGVALPHYASYQTPLGTLKVDTNICTQLADHELFRLHQEAHATEHALEMQLPFIQKTIESCTIVPLIVGVQDHNSVKEIVQALTPHIDAQTLVIATSDFVHYGKSFYYVPFVSDIADNIRELDSMAINAIMNQDYKNFCTFLEDSHATICGRHPISILLALLKAGTLGQVHAQCTGYYTSCHLNKARAANALTFKTLSLPIEDSTVYNGSVSYAAIQFSTSPQTNVPSDYEQAMLLALARRAIENNFAKIPLPNRLLAPLQTPLMNKSLGAFVTIHDAHNNLRGCIGRITTTEPLDATIIAMSQTAAFHDTRFAPIANDEISTLRITITLLTEPKQVHSLDEIIVGKHGIILNKRINNGTLTKSSVFLPKIPTEQGWDLHTTLRQLSLKAGLDVHAWQQDCTFQVFEGFEIKE